MMWAVLPAAATTSQRAVARIELEVDKAEAIVRMVLPVAKSINAERTGILTRGHAHPGRHRDGGNDTLEPAVASRVHQSPKII